MTRLDGGLPSLRVPVHAVVVLALIFAGVVPWRAGAYFEGKLDAVVLGKAACIFLAFVVAMLGPRWRRSVVPAAPVVLLGGYVAVTCLGAFAHGTFAPTLVVAVRVVLVASTLSVLVRTYGVEIIATGLFRVFLAAVVLASATGVTSLARGRLRGGLPPLHPNELAFLGSACLIWVVGRFLRGEERVHDYGLVLVLFAVIYATGSRTTLLAVVLALVAMLRWMTRLSRSGIVLGVAVIPVVAATVFTTDVVAGLASRGGSTNITTLSNRTIAWQAATRSFQDWEDLLFGRGLSVKRIGVRGQWWSSQIFDSSWVSALVQAGVVGVSLAAFWILWMWLRSWRRRGPLSTVWLGWLTLLAIRSGLESGLFDSSLSFTTLWVATLGVLAAGRRGHGEGHSSHLQPEARHHEDSTHAHLQSTQR